MPSIEAIIDRQLRKWEHEHRHVHAGGPVIDRRAMTQPVVTVSRQHGSRGREVAAKLAERFHYTLLHRNTIDRISESTGHLRRLLEALDEHSRSQVSIWVDSMLSGKYLDETDYAAALFKTVHSIARLGGVVVVGRGANFIIGPDAGVHLRIVAPREERIASLARRKGITEAAAGREIDVYDHDRDAFVRKLFHRSVEDPLAYDVVLNQSGRPVNVLVDLATAVAEEKIARLRRKEVFD
jgi:cytidylate kinase